MSESIIVTGCSGFIGFHTAKRLLENGKKVVGIDNINPYYSQQLKQDRSAILGENKNFTFHKNDNTEKQVVDEHCFMRLSIVKIKGDKQVRFGVVYPEPGGTFSIGFNFVCFMFVLYCSNALPN